jgi:hypothetical protein
VPTASKKNAINTGISRGGMEEAAASAAAAASVRRALLFSVVVAAACACCCGVGGGRGRPGMERRRVGVGVHFLWARRSQCWSVCPTSRVLICLGLLLFGLVCWGGWWWWWWVCFLSWLLGVGVVWVCVLVGWV